jgi:diguanylate cyclase (GGDEF)-like protein/PAS domain S-box-containing protein
MDQETSNLPGRRLSPHSIVLIYLLAGFLWIAISDYLLAGIARDIRFFRYVATAKGCIFIVITAALLYILIKRLASDLSLSKDIFYKAFHTSPDSIIISRLEDGKFIQVNEGFSRMSGYGKAETEWEGSFISLWDDEGEGLCFVQSLMDREVVKCFEANLRRKDGKSVTCLLSASLIELDGERCAISIVRDISEQKRGAEEMLKLSHYDAETGLPNLNLLVDRLNQTLALDKRTKRSTVVIYIGLENFKSVIDALGHNGGIDILRIISARLSAMIRQSDTVARIHKDEYVIVCGGSAIEHDLDIILNKVQLVLTNPVVSEHGTIMISAFIGIACSPTDGLTADDLLRNAHIAMNQAREESNHGFQFFSESLNQKAVERQLIETSMLRGIELGEFFVNYQPRFGREGACITGMEALLRWRHPVSGLITPSEFIPISEKNGMIVRLGRWVLEAACRQNKAWQDAGLPAVPVSVNISGRQLADNGFVEQVSSVLSTTGLAPGFLELELTESVVMNTSDETVLKLLRLKELGIRISIDDFGTGYSSLSYLKHLPIDGLKIDRSFVMDIATDHDDNAAIVTAIVAMAESLKLKVVAEGVESKEQHDFLMGLQCHEFQGFYFSKPLEKANMEKLLRHEKTHTADETEYALPLKRDGWIKPKAVPPFRGETEIAKKTNPREFVSDVTVVIPPVAPGEPVIEVLKRFQAEKELFVLPVVHNGKVAGVVNRSTFLEEHIIGKYGFGMHINRSKNIRDLMNTAVFTIEANTLISDFAEAVKVMEDGFRFDNMCVTSDGAYMGIVEVNQLVNAIAEMNLLLARNANPLTGLPGNENIQREINQRLSSGKYCDISYIDIDNFKPYNDHYGFQKGDTVIKSLAEVIASLAHGPAGHSGNFCGHIGGDDFIVISEPFLGHDIAAAIIAGFETNLPLFHGELDYARKSYSSTNRKGEEETFALLSLSIGIVNTLSKPVASYAELASLATEVKKTAKIQNGSSIVVNRRVNKHSDF